MSSNGVHRLVMFPRVEMYKIYFGGEVTKNICTRRGMVQVLGLPGTFALIQLLQGHYGDRGIFYRLARCSYSLQIDIELLNVPTLNVLPQLLMSKPPETPSNCSSLSSSV